MEINQNQNKNKAVNGLFLSLSLVFDFLLQKAKHMICPIPLSDVVHTKNMRLMDRGGHAYHRQRQEALLYEDDKSPPEFIFVLLPFNTHIEDKLMNRFLTV
ncbi:hypothetical protein AHAS_Ahas15G0270200 [Arachis hypogaea]